MDDEFVPDGEQEFEDEENVRDKSDGDEEKEVVDEEEAEDSAKTVKLSKESSSSRGV